MVSRIISARDLLVMVTGLFAKDILLSNLSVKKSE
jgi:hypothetical protein